MEGAFCLVAPEQITAPTEPIIIPYFTLRIHDYLIIIHLLQTLDSYREYSLLYTY